MVFSKECNDTVRTGAQQLSDRVSLLFGALSFNNIANRLIRPINRLFCTVALSATLLSSCSALPQGNEGVCPAEVDPNIPSGGLLQGISKDLSFNDSTKVLYIHLQAPTDPNGQPLAVEGNLYSPVAGRIQEVSPEHIVLENKGYFVYIYNFSPNEGLKVGMVVNLGDVLGLSRLDIGGREEANENNLGLAVSENGEFWNEEKLKEMIQEPIKSCKPGIVGNAVAVANSPEQPKFVPNELCATKAPEGQHCILGTPSITAEKINAVLAKYNSPATNTGEIWIEMGNKYGIDPAYALAFFIHESSAGANPDWAGNKGDGTTTHNIGNIICADYPTCHGRFRDYESWAEGIEDWFRLISKEYVDERDVVTLEQIIPIYAPSFENDVPGYVQAVVNLIDSWRKNPQALQLDPRIKDHAIVPVDENLREKMDEDPLGVMIALSYMYRQGYKKGEEGRFLNFYWV